MVQGGLEILKVVPVEGGALRHRRVVDGLFPGFFRLGELHEFLEPVLLPQHLLLGLFGRFARLHHPRRPALLFLFAVQAEKDRGVADISDGLFVFPNEKLENPEVAPDAPVL